MIKKGIILYLTILLLILVIGGIDSLVESPLILMLLIGLITGGVLYVRKNVSEDEAYILSLNKLLDKIFKQDEKN